MQGRTILHLAFTSLSACGLLWTMTACGSSSSPATSTPSDQTNYSALRQAVQQDLTNNLATGASVAIWRNGKVSWVGGFGTADPNGSKVPDENTLFMIGSDTKKITAISLLRQVEAGKLSPTTTIGEILPNLVMSQAPTYLEATVHELLSHQGDISEIYDLTSQTTDDQLGEFTYGTFARDAYAMAPHGSFWNYSNPNFSVAGLLNQQLDSRPWADIISEDIFRPLAMTRSFARKSQVDANHSLGVKLAEDGKTPQPVSLENTWESAFVRPAGLVWSTPSDQMRLAAFLVDGNSKVLSPTHLNAVHSPQVKLFPDLPGHYGYGLFISRGLMIGSNYYDVPVWFHGGNTETHTSLFYILPEQRFAISILSNGSGDDFSHALSEAIRTLVNLPAPSTPPANPVDVAVLKTLTGSYLDPNLVGEIVISQEGNQLRVKIPYLDQENVPYDPMLTPASTRVWLLNIDNQIFDLAFFDGPNGSMYLRNRSFVATRAAAGLSPNHVPIVPRKLRIARLRQEIRRSSFFSQAMALSNPQFAAAQRSLPTTHPR